MKLLSPTIWEDYELIDCGNFEKLERFGKYTLIRPEPQALWDKRLSENEWENAAHARFKREKQNASYRTGDPENGGWLVYKQTPQSWTIKCPILGKEIFFKISRTSFGHVGVFPEQAENWLYMANAFKKTNISSPRVLNLFAYTGGASLAAKAFGADVTHLDAVKQVVTWAAENMELSGLDNIRWVVEDALKYLKRENTRDKKYDTVILDPPAYGRGPKGEKWVLEEGLQELLDLSYRLLAPGGILIVNLYSLGQSSLTVDNLLSSYKHSEREFGELCINASTGYRLPLGIFGRLIK